MIRIYKYLVTAFLGLWSVTAMGQEADFEIRNFHERTTDLSAISSNYKDLNGNPAALIRMTVRDPQFEFSANMGIIALEKKTGEVYLYVPQDTRRLTVRHPRYGVLKDYAIPVRIRSKVTYDAEIVITGSGQPTVPSIKEPVVPQTYEPVTPTYSYEPQPHPKSSQYYSSPEFHFYAGIGFNAVSLMGPSVSLGLNFKGFMVEGGFVYGLDKVENVTFTLRNSSKTSESYDYSSMKALARVGYQIEAVEHFFITPLAGATFNMISGKSTLNSTSTDYFKESNPMSIHAAVRFSYEVIDHLHLHLTPQYDFSLGGDQIFDVIKQGDSKIKAWGEGFGINVGVIYEF